MSKWLLLIPTEFERKFILPVVEKLESDPGLDVAIEVCGFGPVAAAARTAYLVAQHQPEQVLLLGIAGSYTGAEVGNGYRFSSVGCYGIGVGTGESFQSAEEMGWPHWAETEKGVSIGDVISIVDQDVSRQLLTVCAGSHNQTDVEQRTAVFPDAIAEDMEGFGVALACRLAQTPLTIVRGISNVAGDRDKSNWKTEEAMVAAGELAQQVIYG